MSDSEIHVNLSSLFLKKNLELFTFRGVKKKKNERKAKE